MTATATAKDFATASQIRFLSSLYAERVPFGYDAQWDEEEKLFLPVNVITIREASNLISRGKLADRKPVAPAQRAATGYYVITGKGECEDHESLAGEHMGREVECDGSCKPVETVFVVVESKRNPGRTYAKQLVINPDTHRGKWVFAGGAAGELARMKPLTVTEAARLGKKHGCCMICGRELTDDTNKAKDGLTSIQRGIGWTCFQNEGLAR